MSLPKHGLPSEKGRTAVQRVAGQAQARPMASSKATAFVPRPPKPATRPAAPRLASDARSAARRAFDEDLAAKEAQLAVRAR